MAREDNRRNGLCSTSDMNPRHHCAMGVLLVVLSACEAANTALPLADVRLDPLALPMEPAGGAVSSFEDAESSSDLGFYLQAYSHPAVSLKADEDPSEPGQGIEFEADLRTGDGYGVAAPAVPLRKAEVGELQRVVHGNQHVLRFDVAVGNAVAVAVLHRQHNIPHRLP